jgi:hypothetical protein
MKLRDRIQLALDHGLAYMTADEVAECVEYQGYLPATYGDWRKLYSRLWAISSEAKNPTPLGGDGSNGTVETPCGRLSLDNDDKAAHWIGKLDEVEQDAIAEAFMS